jgi:hypothetical protein
MNKSTRIRHDKFKYMLSFQALAFAEIVLGQKEDIRDMIEKMFLLLATNTTTPNTPSDGQSLICS